MRDRTGITDAEADRAAWTAWPATNRPESDTVQVGGEVGGEVGGKVGGARSIALGLAVGRQARWPTLPWRLPGLPWILDRVYDVVATNRHRLPGETPWCETHPDQCAATAP